MSEKEKSSNTTVYELGFLLAPDIPETDLVEEIESIRSIIEKNDGVVISEGKVAKKTLAYNIDKKSEKGKVSYNQAYFGWIAFECNDIQKIKSKIEKTDTVVRFIIIKTNKNDVEAALKPVSLERKEVKKISEKSHKKELSNEEIDKSIEELIVE